MWKHNTGQVRSTKAYIPWTLIYVEVFSTQSEVMRREQELKSHRDLDFVRWEILPRFEFERGESNI